MKKTFADKLAEKAFQDPKVQQSWAVHMEAFGPILSPAFETDPKSRVHLTAALNHISRREIPAGLKKLEQLERACVTEADRVAWLFFMGLCFEMTGDRGKMIAFYSEANQCRHRFYMPYLKLAKAAHQDAMFDAAAENYNQAAMCFAGAETAPKNQPIAASIYINLASCLTMMHRYEEANDALAVSRRILPNQPGRAAAEAILYAVSGEEEAVEDRIKTLETWVTVLAEPTRKIAEEILAGRHAHFCERPIDEASLAAFWQEFMRCEEELRRKLAQKQHDEVLTWLTEHLTPLFPFMERELEFGIMMGDGIFQLELADFYAVALRRGYEALLERRPKEVDLYWKFVVIH